MEIIVYGDIHGCLEEFIELRKRVPKNKIEICVGDLIDRGKYANEVIEYVMKNNIKSIIGNHEYKHIRKYWGRKVKLDENQKEVYKSFTKESLEFLSNLPMFMKIDNTTILHAGISNKMDLNDKKIEHILYMRDLDENENFLSINHDNPNAKYWAEIYNGNQGFIIHGHQVFSEVTKFPNSIAIDTGCVYGNKLSAIYINDTTKPWEYEVFSVNAKKEYEKYYKKF